MTYAIAEYFTPAQRTRAIEAEYRPLGSVGYPHPRTRDGYCPLGFLMPDGSTYRDPAPSMLAKHTGHIDDGEFIAAARDFVSDWDGGILDYRDLATALGVTDDA